MKKADTTRLLQEGVEPHTKPASAPSEEELQEFIDAYREEFNEKLSKKDAEAMLSQLVQLYLHIMRPLPKKDIEDNT